MPALLFLVILVVLVLVHEVGHFIAARLSGMRVDEFGIGFPPRVLSFVRGETRYSLNAVLLGGFVKIFGEDPHDTSAEPENPRAFNKRPLYAQAFVLVAGVAMNVLLAFACFTAAFTLGVERSVDEHAASPDARLTVLAVIPDSPAARAGIEVGDRIIGVSSARSGEVELAPSVVSTTIARDGLIELSVLRGDASRVIEITAEEGVVPEERARPAIGITMGLLETHALPLHEAALEAAKETYYGAIAIGKGIATLIYNAVLLRADLSSVTGPVGIAGLVGEAAAFGIASLLTFTAFISLNLAVINLLPFPALDGGRLVFVVIEWLKGSPVRQGFAYGANALGFALLMLLMAAVTWNDIAKLLG